MTENPISALILLAFIALIAYLGNRNSNKKTEIRVEQEIKEENIVVKKHKISGMPTIDVKNAIFDNFMEAMNEQL